MAFHPPILVSLSVLLVLLATTGTALPKPWLPASAASQVPQSYQPSTFPPTQLLWPIPSGEVNYGIEDLSFSSPNFVVAVPSCDSQRAGRPGSQSGCAALEAAVTRYVNGSLFFPFVSEETTEVATSVSLTIEVEDVSTASFQLGTNESYCLSVSINGSALLRSETVFGAMRGLETLSQLIQFNTTSALYYMNGLPISLCDTPRFPWRGLMIDTARHYLEPEAVLRTLDAMSYSKLNTLHWHIVDAESFPLDVPTEPDLARYGAYAYPLTIYNQSFVQTVVQNGLERGIRVVPEVDMPGHAYSWGKGNANLTVYCSYYEENIDNIPLNPTLASTYEVISNVISYLSSVFHDEYIHIGGDEVVLGCWDENSEVVNWMKEHGIPDSTALLQYFEDQVTPLAPENSRRFVYWQDVIDNGIQLNETTSIIEVWRDNVEMQKVIDLGYYAILGAGNYLDQQVPCPGCYHYEFEDTWIDFFLNDPTANLTASQAQFVLGGESVMFGEQVDSHVIDTRVWPRACGTAERLWSPSSTDYESALPRLVAHRCRLSQRGIAASPIRPDFCILPQQFNKMKAGT